MARLDNGEIIAGDLALTTPEVIDPGYVGVHRSGRVFILLATYNGGRFIVEQICSIQAQSYSDWELYIRDDGSCDDTVLQVEELSRMDERIHLVRDDLGNRGVVGNFSVLLELALIEKADYVFLADQDDVWHPDKLQTMLAAMNALECKYEATPLLVHADLAVVGENLHPIAPSFSDYAHLSPTTAHLGILLCQNQVTGCACLINRSLLKLAHPVPQGVLMHDWWLALLAASTGKIGFIPTQLVKYRQHGGNVLGAISFMHRLKHLLSSRHEWRVRMDVIKGGVMQARHLEQRLRETGAAVPPAVMSQVSAYADVLAQPGLSRVAYLKRRHIGRPGGGTRLLFDILITLIGKT